MDARITPFGGHIAPAMLDWVVMDVGDVVAEVLFVSNRVFPESRLPWSAHGYSTRESFLEVLDQS